MTISKDKVVSIHYTLTNSSGDVVDSSRDREPLHYLHGAGTIIRGLEAALEGKDVGDVFQVTVQPADAYGERRSANLQRVPAKHFRNPKSLRPGQIVGLQTKQGPVQVTVVKVGRFNVDVDANHPLAGQVLNFDVEVTGVRDAMSDEKQHGHVHGPGGVQH